MRSHFLFLCVRIIIFMRSHYVRITNALHTHKVTYYKPNIERIIPIRIKIVGIKKDKRPLCSERYCFTSGFKHFLITSTIPINTIRIKPEHTTIKKSEISLSIKYSFPVLIFINNIERSKFNVNNRIT